VSLCPLTDPEFEPELGVGSHAAGLRPVGQKPAASVT
jgi:hypothetical protein